MLRKNTDLKIDPENPFKEDRLHRLDSAENLTQLIRTISQPFVLSINAPFGTGKTTFIKMWETKLRKEGQACLYFNAWENDFSDDPLISFIGEIESYIDTRKLTVDPKTKISATFQKLKQVSGKILKKTSPLALRLGTMGIFNDFEEIKTLLNSVPGGDKEIANFVAKLAEEKINSYEAEKRNIFTFKQNLEEFTTVIASEAKLKLPLIFFIDELDRCRPNYAIQLLEKIKHLFNVQHITFILAIDRQQIIHSIKSLYGIGMDGEGYLRRFIDLDYQLPKSASKDFCSHLFQKFNFEEIFLKRPKGRDEKEQLLDIFIKLSEVFNFSLRVQEQCFTQFNIILRTTHPNQPIFPYYLAFLVALKAATSTLYRQLSSNEARPDEILSFLKASKAGTDFLQTDHGALIEAYLICSFLDRGETFTVVEQFKQKSLNEPNSDIKKRDESILKFLDWILGVEHQGAGRYLANKIEFTERFNLNE